MPSDFWGKISAAKAFYECGPQAQGPWWGALGASKSAVYKYSRGERSTMPIEVDAILDRANELTGLPLDWLWSEEGRPVPMTTLERDDLLREMARQVTALVAASDAEREGHGRTYG